MIVVSEFATLADREDCITQESYFTICSRILYDIFLNTFLECEKFRKSWKQQGGTEELFTQVLKNSCI